MSVRWTCWAIAADALVRTQDVNRVTVGETLTSMFDAAYELGHAHGKLEAIREAAESSWGNPGKQPESLD